VAPQITINGLEVEILSQKKKVKIFDESGDLSKKEALLILKYLHAEGFVSGDKILLEIVTDYDI